VDEQRFPHAPQLFTSRSVSTQASAQSVAFPRHSNPHVPLVHVATAFAGAGHFFAQLPQLFTSVRVSTQLPEQSVVPAAQLVTQAPSKHTCPTAQTFPQAPQWERLVAVSTQAPLQWVYPGSQATPQRPALQTGTPLPSGGSGHAVVHVPQWSASVRRSRHRPSQSVKPRAH
jgi:hypothetical protein